jgi:hypothetical protein
MKCLLLFLAWCFPFALKAQVYPEWFLYPSRYPNLVVGFTYNQTPAETDGARMYCVYQECIADGKYIVYTNEKDDRFLIESDYYYYFPDSLLQAVQERLYQVDCFITSLARRDMACLFSLDSAVGVPRKFVDISQLPEPDWIKKRFWVENGYVYGVGLYTSQGNKNDAWKTAEEQAFFAIMTNIVTKFYSIRLATESNVTREKLYETATALKLKFQLKNIEVLERWNSVKDELFYVLVRIKQSDIRSPFLAVQSQLQDSLRVHRPAPAPTPTKPSKVKLIQGKK